MKPWFLLLAALLFLPLHAGENPLAVQLMSDHRAIAPGREFTVGIVLRPPPDHHVYWKHPGIVGMPTVVEWDLPPGLRAGDTRWPAPGLVKMGSHTAQGYDHPTVLQIPFAAAPDLPPGTPVTLTARLSWMCCGAKCSPAQGLRFSLTLPVADSPESDPEMAALLASVAAENPHRSDHWTATSSLGEDGLFRLRLVPAEGHADPLPESVRFFTSDGQIDTNAPQHPTPLPGGGIEFTLTPTRLSPPKLPLRGILLADRPWSPETTSRALDLP